MKINIDPKAKEYIQKESNDNTITIGIRQIGSG